MGVLRRIVLMFVSRENSLNLHWSCRGYRGPLRQAQGRLSTAVDRRAWARRSILAQDDNVSENPSSVPADRCFVQVDVDLLGFEIFFDAPGTEFTAEAGLFVSAPGGFDVRGLHVIHPDDACTQGLYGTHRLENVAGPYCSG